MLKRLVLTLGLLLAAPTLAHAEPITIAIFGAAFAATTAGAVVTFLISSAISLAVGLLSQAVFRPEEPVPPGVQLDVEIGDDAPIGFTVGTYATAGTRKYSGVWGRSGDTPNAFLTDVIELGNIPAPGRPGLWVNGKKCTVLWDEEPNEQGYRVAEFVGSGGKNNLWVRYFDGTQTTADPFLLDKFGGHEDRPWRDDMIGRGCPYVTITARFNRKLFPGQVSWVFEPPPPAFYDVRKDDTAGGEGDHRRNDPSTWEPTSNNAVIVSNIIRGVYYGDEWVYGGQDTPAFRLPASNWMAGANECDAGIDLVGGGQEAQFRCGYEIRGDLEPLAVIEELLKAGSARMSESGGIFKILVGAPGAAVYSFTDGDILVTKGQSLKPFPGLDETHNAVEATYPEPEEMWSSKDAPALYDDELEEEDGDRRLPTSVNFAAAPFPTQVQRLMKMMRDDARRFRVHSFFLPPEAWLLEPNDVVSWSSARNGYVNKKFLISRIDGEPGMNQLVLLKEIDPADGSWNHETDERPTSTGVLGPIAVPPQAMAGWQAAPATLKDASGTDRRPSIRVTYSGDQEDVRAIRVQVRLKESGDIVFDGELPYGDPDDATKENVLNGTFLPDEEYEVRGMFVPFTGRLTDWSDWIAVTTPDTRITDVTVGLDAATPGLQAALAAMNARQDALDQRMEQIALNGGEVAGSVSKENSVSRKFRNATAVALEEMTAAIGTDESGKLTAVAMILATLLSTVGNSTAGILWQMTTEVVEDGDVSARVILQTRASVDDDWVSAGTIWEAGFTGGDPGQPFSQIVLDALRTVILVAGVPVGLFSDDGLLLRKALIGDLDASNITADKLDAMEILQNGTLLEDIIAFGAVTESVDLNFTDSHSWSSGPGSYNSTDQTMASAVLNNPSGNPVLITLRFTARATYDGSGTATTQVHLKRDGTTLRTFARTNGGNLADEATFWDSNPPEGAATYTVTRHFFGTGGGGTSLSWGATSATSLVFWKR